MTDTVAKIKRLGIIAGNGQLPVECARGARNAGVEFICAVGIKGETDPVIEDLLDDMFWTDIGKLGRLIEYFVSKDIKDVVMIGQLNPRHAVSTLLKSDTRMMKMLMKLKDRRADTILGAVADELAVDGLTVIDSTTFIPHLMAPEGVWGKQKPSDEERADIDFGFKIAKELGAVDAGQTVVVKKLAVVALEAMEGSDAAIARGCSIVKKDAIVVKVSKPKQDVRFDVPVIGDKTLKTLIAGKARAIGVEAGKTIVLDREELIKIADKKKICLVGV